MPCTLTPLPCGSLFILRMFDLDVQRLATQQVGRGSMRWWIPLEGNLLAFNRDIGMQLIPTILAGQRNLDMLFIHLQAARNRGQQVGPDQFQQLWIQLHAVLNQNHLQTFLRQLARSRLLPTVHKSKHTHILTLPPLQDGYERTRFSASAGPNPIRRRNRSSSVGAASTSSRGTSSPSIR